MKVKCDICGNEFDHTESEECLCGYGCTGGTVKCPECGVHVELPEGFREEHKKETEENSVFAKMEKELGMR